MNKGGMKMNKLNKVYFPLVIKVFLTLSTMCFMVCCAFGMRHVPKHIVLSNELVNNDKRFMMAEEICEVELCESNTYLVSYNTHQILTPEMRTRLGLEIEDLESKLGKGNVPEHIFRRSDENWISGWMPPKIRKLFDKMDKFCYRFENDNFAVSINSKIIDNGEYNSAVAYVITNTPPPTTTNQNEYHPLLEKLKETSYSTNCSSTNSIPIGADPGKWIESL